MSATDQDSQLRDITEAALLSDDPTVQRALAQEKAFRVRTEAELDILLSEVRTEMSDQDAEAIKKQVTDRIDFDLALSKKLNKALSSYECTIPLRTNKMTFVLLGSQAFLQKYFDDVFFAGSIPQGYEYQSKHSDVTILGENSYTIYGSSKATFFKAAALTTYLVCKGFANLSAVKLGDSSNSWIDETALAHVVPLPETLNLRAAKISDLDLEKFSYRFRDEKTPNGFAYVHSGYAYGGHRNEQRYPDGKLYGPEDCSSWAAKITGCPIPFTTADQLYFYRLKLEKDFIAEEWKKGSECQHMGNLFDVVNVRDPQRDILPGQIYCHRDFDINQDPAMENTLGTSGHTGLILGFQSNGEDSQIVILNYSRDMPKVEGFGVKAFPLFPKPENASKDTKVMIFSLNGQQAASSSSGGISDIAAGSSSVKPSPKQAWT